ncbi:Fc.00g082720.m01.CDS01 [Cosmosporella sp. VM-42]
MELQDYTEKNTDAVIATVILFICVDVVESGDRGWKYHLQGARELIRSRKSLLNDEGSEFTGWLKYFDTACTTFGIMGATFADTDDAFPQVSITEESSFLEIIRQSEDQTWVGCPAELLLLLSAINSLRSVPRVAAERSQTVRIIRNRLSKFLPSTWARNFPDQDHYEARFHLAYAYKAAVEVYASHAVDAIPGEQYLSKHYVTGLIQPAIAHMLAITPRDFHIKSLVWPAFVLGAETQIVEHRKVVRTIFQHIWISSCCCNARKAAEMLAEIWNRDPYKSTEKTWLNYIYEREESWLFL